MKEIRIDEMINRAQNKFLLVNATIVRAKQILAGSLPYVDDFDPTDSIKTALKELSAEKLKIKLGKGAAKPLEIVHEEEKKRPSLAKEEKKKTTVKKKKK